MWEDVLGINFKYVSQFFNISPLVKEEKKIDKQKTFDTHAPSTAKRF